jgi:hypothetical protein
MKLSAPPRHIVTAKRRKTGLYYGAAFGAAAALRVSWPAPATGALELGPFVKFLAAA